MVVPVNELMIKTMDGKGSMLALTYHTGEVCRNREVELDKALASHPDIKVTKNEVRIPGYFEDGAQYANAWLASHPAGDENLAIWGCWDDPAIGAIGSLRAQGRDDVKVYGVNGNAQALENIKNGFMTATAWQDSYTEGYNMIKMLPDIQKAGAGWQPKAVEVPAVLVTKDTVEAVHRRASGRAEVNHGVTRGDERSSRDRTETSRAAPVRVRRSRSRKSYRRRAGAARRFAVDPARRGAWPGRRQRRRQVDADPGAGRPDRAR